MEFQPVMPQRPAPMDRAHFEEADRLAP